MGQGLTGASQLKRVRVVATNVIAIHLCRMYELRLLRILRTHCDPSVDPGDPVIPSFPARPQHEACPKRAMPTHLD